MYRVSEHCISPFVNRHLKVFSCFNELVIHNPLDASLPLVLRHRDMQFWICKVINQYEDQVLFYGKRTTEPRYYINMYLR